MSYRNFMRDLEQRRRRQRAIEERIKLGNPATAVTIAEGDAKRPLTQLKERPFTAQAVGTPTMHNNTERVTKQEKR